MLNTKYRRGYTCAQDRRRGKTFSPKNAPKNLYKVKYLCKVSFLAAAKKSGFVPYHGISYSNWALVAPKRE